MTQQLASPPCRQSEPAGTFWEAIAQKRWGKYLSAIEEDVLRSAADQAPAPGVGLEIGCEGGRWCRLLVDLGWQMTGIDVDAEALERCQQRTPSLRCILATPDDQRIPAESASIDLLVCLEVPPVINSTWFVPEARRVLKPGGQLVGSLNNIISWRGAANRFTTRLKRWQHFYSKSYFSLHRSFQDNGFSIDEARGCCWAPFGRLSDSSWIPLAVTLEKRLGLQTLPHVSPWVIFRATRRQ